MSRRKVQSAKRKVQSAGRRVAAKAKPAPQAAQPLSAWRFSRFAELPDFSEPKGRKGFTGRAWESAETHRLNAAHWKHANGAPINADLLDQLEALRNRIAYELQNNPDAEHVVRTWVQDMYGGSGPTLQLLTDRTSWAEKAEQVWRQWCTECDAAGRRHFVDFLRLGERGLWDNGEWFWQRVTGTTPGESGVALRLRAIHPRRVGNPASQSADGTTLLGVKRDPEGRVLGYHVHKLADHLFGWLSQEEPAFVAAEHMIHVFSELEPDQVRGVPWMAVLLSNFADFRDYDDDVLAAARQAAMQVILLWTTHADAQFNPVAGTETLERGTVSFCPPGYQPFSNTPAQPSTRYVEYRTERQGDHGKACGMPRMIVRGDASQMNYSSARFDLERYRQALTSQHGLRTRYALDPVVSAVLREAHLAGRLPKRPADLEMSWIWPALPNVDREKEAQGERVEMENGTVPWSEQVARRNGDPERVLRQWKRDNERRVAAGLEPITGWSKEPATREAAPAEDSSDAAAAAAEGVR